MHARVRHEEHAQSQGSGSHDVHPRWAAGEGGAVCPADQPAEATGHSFPGTAHASNVGRNELRAKGGLGTPHGTDECPHGICQGCQRGRAGLEGDRGREAVCTDTCAGQCSGEGGGHGGAGADQVCHAVHHGLQVCRNAVLSDEVLRQLALRLPGQLQERLHCGLHLQLAEGGGEALCRLQLH